MKPLIPFLLLFSVMIGCKEKRSMNQPIVGYTLQWMGSDSLHSGGGAGRVIEFTDYPKADTIIIWYYEPIYKRIEYIKQKDSTWKILKETDYSRY